MFSFRPIARSDFPTLAHWLAQPHVARWWADDPSPEAMEADYGGCIDGTEPAEVFIALRDGKPFGLVQRLLWAAYPGYVAELESIMPAPHDAWSIDYLVGEERDTGNGLGTRMLDAFTAKLWRDVASATTVIVPVHQDNRASWRVLERIGYHRAASGELDPDNPADSRHHFIYRLDRPQAG